MLIDRFLHYIKYEKGYSSHTFVSYENDLSQFREYVESRGCSFVPSEISSIEIREWIMKMMDEGMSEKSVHRKVSSVSSFFKFLRTKGYVENDPMKKVKTPKRKKKLPFYLHEAEMTQLLDLGSYFSEDFAGVRDRLVVEMFYNLGIRLSELIGLTDGDVNLQSRTVRVFGKGSKVRYVPYGDTLAEVVDQYLTLRREQVGEACDAFIVRESGEALYPMLVYRKVKKYISEVSSVTKKSPHVLRHTFATAMLNNGAEIEAVKELLGHSSLAATEVYTHTTFEQIEKNYKQAHPRA